MRDGEASTYTATILGSDLDLVCRLDFGYGRGPLDEVIARRIVSAVNCHTDLLALAHRVAAHFADTDAPLGVAARDLIAQVEGDGPR